VREKTVTLVVVMRVAMTTSGAAGEIGRAICSTRGIAGDHRVTTGVREMETEKTVIAIVAAIVMT